MYRKNVGTLDRLVRLVVAAVLLAIGLFPLDGLQGRPLGLFAIVLGVAALATALTGRCPGYVPFGIDTRRTADAAGSTDRRPGFLEGH